MKQTSTKEERFCLNITSNKMDLWSSGDRWFQAMLWMDSSSSAHINTQPEKIGPTLLKLLPHLSFPFPSSVRNAIMNELLLHRAPCGSRLFGVLRDCLISSGLSNKSHCAFRRLSFEAETVAVKEKKTFDAGYCVSRQIWALCGEASLYK